MTELEHLAEEVRLTSEAHAERTSRQVLRSYQRRATVGFTVLVLGLIGGRALDIQSSTDARHAIVRSGNVVSIAGCNDTYKVILGTKGLLEAAKAGVARGHAAGITSDDAFKAANEFYDDQLGKLRLPDCRIAGKILTTDLNNVVKPEKPLYEGAPYAPKS